MALSRTRYGSPVGGPAFVAGMGLELSTRDPTVLICGREITWSGVEGLAALAGCDATARQSTTDAVKAHLITRIYAPLPAGPGRNVWRFLGRPPGPRGSSSAGRCPVKGLRRKRADLVPEYPARTASARRPSVLRRLRSCDADRSPASRPSRRCRRPERGDRRCPRRCRTGRRGSPSAEASERGPAPAASSR